MNIFDLSGKTALITGGSGLLGPKHAEAILEFGGNIILTDISNFTLKEKARELSNKYKGRVFYKCMDITNLKSIQKCINYFEHRGVKIDILINNAAKDPKVIKDSVFENSNRFETMSQSFWKEGIDVTINGTFLITQSVINHMLKNNIKGVILNIASDLAVIAPDQRIYKVDGIPEDLQPVKPITYSVSKWAMIGMTKYLATYFADKGIRINSISPSGIFNDHPEEFVKKLSNLIPMGRMANIDEYKGSIIYLCSDASSYMTGQNIIIDGGKTVW